MAKSSSEKGHSFSLVALLSMFSSSGLLPVKDLIRSLLNKEAPSKLLYKNVLSDVRLAYLRNILAKLVNGQPLTLDNSKRINSL